MFGPVLLVVLGVLSSPAIILMEKRDFGILGQVWYLIVSIPDLCNLITLLPLCSVALPLGVVGWYAVCGCGISWPYSLTFWAHILN